MRSWRPPLSLVMTGITVTIGLAPAVVERGLYAWLLAEPDQVAGGRKRQLEPPALAAGQRLARRQPDRIGGFLAVMGAGLLRRCRGKEEPGVEPLRHALRRDPVRVGHEFVERQPQSVVGRAPSRNVVLPSHKAVRCAASISPARLASTRPSIPAGRASRMPLSSKVSRIAAIRKLRAAASSPSPPE